MKGEGKAYGAVTIVNAISTGLGSALSIDLRTIAEVEITEDGRIILESARDRYGALEQVGEDALTREVISCLFSKLGVKGKGCRVKVRSEIPVAVGLKSSSSAAVAIALAVLDALGEEMEKLEVLRAVAEASIRSSTSITGAIDDASACMLGGAVVTDNYRKEIVKREEITDDIAIIIAVPLKKQYTKNFRKELLEPVAKLVKVAYDLALRGDYWAAMTLNGILHATTLSLPVELILESLRAGALAAGVSGTGPALVAISREGEIKGIAKALEDYATKELIVCKANNNSAKG